MSKRAIGLTVIFRPRSNIILIQYLPLYFRHSRRCITGFEPFLYPSWLYALAPIPIPFIMPNRLTSAPYLALGNYAIYAYLIYLTHVPYAIMAVPQTPFNYSISRFSLIPCSTIIFTFSIIPYLILFVKNIF